MGHNLPQTAEELKPRRRQRTFLVLARPGLAAVEKLAHTFKFVFENGDYEYLDAADVKADGVDPDTLHKVLVARLKEPQYVKYECDVCDKLPAGDHGERRCAQCVELYGNDYRPDLTSRNGM